MNNTALRAEKEITNNNYLQNEETTKNFNQTYMKKCRRQDVYHKALIYCLGISEDTRVNIDRIYDLRTGYVKTECFQEGWQTSGSVRIVRMALIYTVTVHRAYMTMKVKKRNYKSMQVVHRRELFCCGYARYFWEAIKIRYPEYCF